MNDRECLRTSTNVWRSRCDHCELMANCIRKPIRHTFATCETSITFETPQKRPRMLTNSYACLAIICDHYEFMANCIRKPIRHSVRLALLFGELSNIRSTLRYFVNVRVIRAKTARRHRLIISLLLNMLFITQSQVES